MWKIISDKFEIKQEYAADFKNVARINVDALRAGGEGWRWVQANLPQLDASIYHSVMQTIESERLSFEASQKRIIDIARQHNDLVAKFPGAGDGAYLAMPAIAVVAALAVFYRRYITWLEYAAVLLSGIVVHMIAAQLHAGNASHKGILCRSPDVRVQRRSRF